MGRDVALPAAEAVGPEAVRAHAPDRVTPARSPAGGPSAPGLQRLQATAGNAAVGRLLTFQPKLALSTPGDRWERAADGVAGRVVAGSAPAPAVLAPRLPVGGAGRGVARVPAGEAAAAAPTTATPAVEALVAAPGGGAPLPGEARGRIEAELGVDLGGVRVHTGPAAAQAAAGIGARAFTHGSDIFLAAGESPDDLALVAHEAAHVVQQGAGGARSETLARKISGADLPGAGIVVDAVRAIPGYGLLSIVIGEDPITGEPVAAGRAELVQTLLGYGPFAGAVGPVLQAMDALDEIFALVRRRLGEHNLTLARIEHDVGAAWDEIDLLGSLDANAAIVRRYVNAFVADVRAFASAVAGDVLDAVRRAAVAFVRPLVQSPEVKPYWDLGVKVFHHDPLTGEQVDAPTVEILADFLKLIHKEQALAQMTERGTLQKTADWLDTQFATFNNLLAQATSLFADAWAAISPENLPNLVGNLQSLAQRAYALLQGVGSFASTVIGQVLVLVKESLLGYLSEQAHHTRGFGLLTVILGRDPFTGEAVPRTAENLIKGFITLLPNGEQMYAQLAESGVIAEAAGRIETAMTTLGISWELITGTFHAIWDALSLEDLLNPIGAALRIIDQFGEPLGRIVSFVATVVGVVIELILRLMNFPSDLLGNILANAQAAIEDIQRDPVQFLRNVVLALKQGVVGFLDKIGTYLLQGLTDWLFRGLRGMGIEPPADLSVGSIITFVLQVLGVSVETLWTKLGAKIGPERVVQIRSALDRAGEAWQFVKDVQERGISAVWEFISGQLSNLWDLLLQRAKDWIMTEIIEKVTAKLLSMLDPTGIMAIINSCIAFFNAVQSAIEYLREILQIIDRYVSTIAAVAKGDVGPGATMLEQGLASAVPVAIGFLANQVGLGNVPEKVVEIIRGLQELIDRALDWLFDQAWRLGQAALNALGVGGGQEGAQDPGEEGDWIAQWPDGGHTMKLRRDFHLFRFSEPEELSAENAKTLLQALLEVKVPPQPFTYPTDSSGRAQGPSGHVKAVRDSSERSTSDMPKVASMPGGYYAYQPGDQRGHLIGYRFFGADETGNFVPMHQTLNTSTFKTWENSVAAEWKALTLAGRPGLIWMHVVPAYPPADPARPGAEFRPTSISASCKVLTLKGSGGQLELLDKVVEMTSSNPSRAVEFVNLNDAGEADLLAVFSGFIDRDVHAIVEAILRVRPKRSAEAFATSIALLLDPDKIDKWSNMINARSSRLRVE